MCWYDIIGKVSIYNDSQRSLVFPKIPKNVSNWLPAGPTIRHSTAQYTIYVCRDVVQINDGIVKTHKHFFIPNCSTIVIPLWILVKPSQSSKDNYYSREHTWSDFMYTKYPTKEKDLWPEKENRLILTNKRDPSPETPSWLSKNTSKYDTPIASSRFLSLSTACSSETTTSGAMTWFFANSLKNLPI